MWWFPYSLTHADTVLWLAYRTDSPPPSPSPLSSITTPLYSQLVHLVHGFLFILATHLCPPLQPLLNTLIFWAQAWALPRVVPPQAGWEAQTMDCLYSQLVDEWAVPLSPAAEASLDEHGSFFTA
jgi:D-arabinono-1,4-lactone oxidase